MHVIIGRTLHSWVGIRFPPSAWSLINAVTWHLIAASALQSRYAFGEQERLVGEILRHIFRPLMVIIEPYNVKSTASKQVIVGRRFIATGRNGT